MKIFKTIRPNSIMITSVISFKDLLKKKKKRLTSRNYFCFLPYMNRQLASIPLFRQLRNYCNSRDTTTQQHAKR